MRRALLCLPILVIVILLLPIGAGALDEEYLLQPEEGALYIPLTCWDGQILTIRISVSGAGEAPPYVGVDVNITQNGVELFSRTNLWDLTWSFWCFTWATNLNSFVILSMSISTPSATSLIVGVTTTMTLIREVILIDLMIISALTIFSIFVGLGIRRSQWWKYRKITVTQSLQVHV